MPERHGALAGSQYRADQQDLGFPPGRAAKQHGEGMEYGYNRVGQGEHRLAFFQEGPASLPCSYDSSNFCAKSRLGGVVKRVCSRSSLPGVGKWPGMTPLSWHNGSPLRATA